MPTKNAIRRGIIRRTVIATDVRTKESVMGKMMMTKMLTTKEVSERLGIDLLKARKIMDDPSFPKIKFGPRTFRVPDDSLEEWLKTRAECWKPLIYGNIDLTDRYEVSNNGKIRTVFNKKILKQHENKQGYMTICISFGKKKRKVLKMHRAVAYMFLDNPNHYPVVNHLDGNKTNNNAKNLEWCTVQDNVRHAIRTGLCKPGIYPRKRE